MTAALMHLDGCHFYVWVDTEGRLTYDERTGGNLSLHRSEEPCDRCSALSRGAKPLHIERDIAPIPDDSKALMFKVFEALGEIQEAHG
jgi:hypothetical protein